MKLAEELAATDQHDVRARRDLAITYRRLARALVRTEPNEAGKYFRTALQIAEALRASDPQSLDFRRDVMEANLGLGILAGKTRSAESLDRLKQALELQKDIESAAPYRVWVVRYITQIYVALGDELLRRGDESGALANYQLALAAADRLLTRAPSCLYLVRDRADVLEATGRYYRQVAGRSRPESRAQAKANFEQSLTIWRDWTRRNIGAPYAARRQANVESEIAGLAH